jgi:hypothetical protein
MEMTWIIVLVVIKLVCVYGVSLKCKDEQRL